MPILGFGVWQMPGARCIAPCEAALEAGYRHIDSAIVYRNEAEVGQIIRNSGLKREDLFVTSKIASRLHGNGAAAAIEESLARFDIGYLDLYLIHDPLSGTKRRLQTWEALIQKRDEGKIRSIGVSN